MSDEMWNYIVLEGYCLGTSIDKRPPCGRRISTFCLTNGHCPYFAFANSNEREAAFGVPLLLIFWDKAKELVNEITAKLSWQLWDRWHYDKVWLEKLPIAECPAWGLKKAQEDFPSWFKAASLQDIKK